MRNVATVNFGMSIHRARGRVSRCRSRNHAGLRWSLCHRVCRSKIITERNLVCEWYTWQAVRYSLDPYYSPKESLLVWTSVPAYHELGWDRRASRFRWSPDGDFQWGMFESKEGKAEHYRIYVLNENLCYKYRHLKRHLITRFLVSVRWGMHWCKNGGWGPTRFSDNWRHILFSPYFFNIFFKAWPTIYALGFECAEILNLALW